MKIISVIITPPDYPISGAVNAAKKLSMETSKFCKLDLLIMSKENSVKMVDNLSIHNLKCRNKLLGINNILSNSIKNTFWTSDINLYIKKNKPDLVHIHNPIPPLALWDVCKFCLKNNIPYVISSHGFVEMFNFKKAFNIGKIKSLFINPLIVKPFYKSIINSSALFILSPNEIKIIKDKINYTKEMYLVPNGYDSFFLKKSNMIIKNELIKKFNLNLQIPIFSFIGNHTHNKGIDIILKSLKYIKGDFKIIIGGAIRSKDEIKNLINSTDLLEGENRYIFTDFLTDEEVLALYEISNCFVFPSRSDTFPLVILDAMASKLPIISTKVGGIPYQVDDSCGILINPDSPDELASAIQKFINKKELFQIMGSNSKEKVLNNFKWEDSATKAYNAYKEIIKN